MKVDNKIVQSDMGVTYRTIEFTDKPFCGYGNYEQMPEEKQEVTYTWDQPRVKDPSADYKPGRFKHLDEAIKNTRKK